VAAKPHYRQSCPCLWDTNDRPHLVSLSFHMKNALPCYDPPKVYRDRAEFLEAIGVRRLVQPKKRISVNEPEEHSVSLTCE